MERAQQGIQDLKINKINNSHGVNQSIQKIVVIGNGPLASSILKAIQIQDPNTALTNLTYPSQTSALRSSQHDTHTHGTHDAHVADSVLHVTSTFAPDSLIEIFRHQDLVISTLSLGTDVALQKSIIDCAIRAGVRRFVPYEFDPYSLGEVALQRLNSALGKARVREYLTQLSHAGTDGNGKLEYVAVFTGCILDQRLANGDLGIDLKWQSATVIGSAETRFAASSLERVGVAIARLVEHWDEVRNRVLHVPGCITTTREVLDLLQKMTGQEYEVGSTDVASAVREGENRIQRGFPDAGMALLERTIQCDESANGLQSFEAENARELLGLEEESIGAILSRALHISEHEQGKDCGCK